MNVIICIIRSSSTTIIIIIMIIMIIIIVIVIICISLLFSTVQAELDAVMDYWSKIQAECVKQTRATTQNNKHQLN